MNSRLPRLYREYAIGGGRHYRLIDLSDRHETRRRGEFTPCVGYGARVARTVVLVDDAPDVRSMLRIALRYDPELELLDETGTGAGAIDRARDLQPHAVVLDLMLPDMAGREVFEEIRIAAPRTDIVVYSGRDTDRRWYETRNAAYVRKDDNLRDLLNALRGATA